MSYSPAHARLTLRMDSHCFLTGVTAICNTVWQAIIPFINSHLLLSRRHTRSSSYGQRIRSVKHCWDQTVRPLIAHTTCAPHRRPLPTPTIKGRTSRPAVFLSGSTVTTRQQEERKKEAEVSLTPIGSLRLEISRRIKRAGAARRISKFYVRFKVLSFALHAPPLCSAVFLFLPHRVRRGILFSLVTT